jgi:pyruvate carboxylase subunit B
MKSRVEVDGVAYEVEFDTPNGHAVPEVVVRSAGGDELLRAPAEMFRVGGNVHALFIGGAVETALLAKGADGSLAVALEGRSPWKCRVLDERALLSESLRGPARKGREVVRSVMPGIIVSILVEVGQEVEVDTPLLIMEAMKMQNEIVAESAGRVMAIHAQAGHAVASGDPLVEIAS